MHFDYIVNFIPFFDRIPVKSKYVHNDHYHSYNKYEPLKWMMHESKDRVDETLLSKSA